MESVFGNYMVAGADRPGHRARISSAGPAAPPPCRRRSCCSSSRCGCAVVSLLVALDDPAEPRQAEDFSATRSRCRSPSCCATPGLIPVIVAGVIMISASDIILIYVPLLGAERSIDVQDIGLLLTVRAAASMVARLFYARMVAAARPLAADDREHRRLRRRRSRRSPCRLPLCGMYVDHGGDGLLVRARHHAEHHHRGRHDRGAGARHRQHAAHHGQPARPVRAAVRRRPGRRRDRPVRPARGDGGGHPGVGRGDVLEAAGEAEARE